MKSKMVLLSLILVFFMGCDNFASKPHGLSWSTDSGMLLKKLRVDYSIIKCEWTMASVKYGKDSLPIGPPEASDGYMCGIVYLTKEETTGLMSKYDWVSFPDSQFAELPNNCAIQSRWFYDESQKHVFIEHGLSDNAGWFYSKSYSLEFSRKSPFCQGRILLDPKRGIIYFFLHSI